MRKIGDKIGTTTMIYRIRDFPNIKLLVQSSSKISPIIRFHDVEARLIDVAVEYEGLLDQCFYCKKECPKKINGNMRLRQHKGQVARQENIGVEW